MQIENVLSIELIKQLKSIARQPRVYVATHKIQDFVTPTKDHGRRCVGGMRPKDLSTSNLLGVLEQATVFGIRSRV